VDIIYSPLKIRGEIMEESLCSIEILKRPDSFLARIQTDLGGVREVKSTTFEGVLEQVVLDLQEEFDVTL
jgi:hypothetical protein